VNAWWWVPIGLAAWFLVALAVGLCLGPVLGRCAEAREALEGQLAESDVHYPRPRDERQASLRVDLPSSLAQYAPPRETYSLPRSSTPLRSPREHLPHPTRRGL